ncbi:MAG: DUF4199 domain-containing protein [Pseudomonadota bacterium]
MKHYMLRYGAIAGLISILTIIAGHAMGGTNSGLASQAFGYASMLVALSMIFVAIKRHRDRDLGGVITFGQAVLLGLGVTFIAGVAYVLTWEVYLALTDYQFISEYGAQHMAKLKADGASVEEIASFEKIMVTYREAPWFRIPMTFIEILPVGALVTLVSAGVLRNSRALPA